VSKTRDYIRAAMRDGGAVFYLAPQQYAPDDPQLMDEEMRRQDRYLRLTPGRAFTPQMFAGGTYEVEALTDEQVEAVARAVRNHGWRIAVMVGLPEFDLDGGRLPFAEVPAEPRGLRRLMRLMLG
jgi:hypothetical protein